MKTIVRITLFFVLAFGSLESFSHSGRTNSEGCHNNRKTGGYHCHNGSRVRPRATAKPIRSASSVKQGMGAKSEKALLCYQCCVGEVGVTKRACTKSGYVNWKRGGSCGC